MHLAGRVRNVRLFPRRKPVEHAGGFDTLQCRYTVKVPGSMSPIGNHGVVEIGVDCMWFSQSGRSGYPLYRDGVSISHRRIPFFIDEYRLSDGRSRLDVEPTDHHLWLETLVMYGWPMPDADDP